FQMGQDYAFSKIAADEAGLRIKDLYLNYRIAEAFQITAGQFRVPFLRQNLASAFNQLLVDRSAVPALRPAREGSRDTGAMLWGNLGTFQYRAALLDGSDQEDTNSRSALRGTARVAWNRFERETGLGATGTAIGAKRILQVAAQVDLQGARHDARDEIGFTTAWRDYRAWAGELFYDQPFDGGSALTVEAAWLERRDDYRDPGFATREIAASYAQAGWLLAPEIGGGRLQLAARYEKVRSDRGGLEARSTGRTIGVNWYAAGHDRKIQADYTRRNEEPVGIDNDEVRLSLVVVF
ncbi:MAG: porin, partial [Candidatus Polarisedimenticolia bacterium]